MPKRTVLLANAHEPLGRPPAPQPTSDRGFGLLLAGLTATLGIGRPLLFGAAPWWPVYALIAALVAVALVAPGLLTPLNRGSRWLGATVRALLSTVVMTALFFGLVTPLAAVMRLFGRRPLSLDSDSSATTYWIRRDPPGPSGASLRHPF
jgi:hypothetical protein